VKVNITEVINRREVRPFTVTIFIEDRDQLYALTLAAGRMCNGHGNDLYDCLLQKCQDFDVDATDPALTRPR
jgi:hypothetical protein